MSTKNVRISERIMHLLALIRETELSASKALMLSGVEVTAQGYDADM